MANRFFTRSFALGGVTVNLGTKVQTTGSTPEDRLSNANDLWRRKLLNANDLLRDADPTVRMPLAYANPYQLRTVIPWNRQRLTLADQSLPSYGNTSHVQFLGSNATWGSQQQVNRRQYNLADQSDATDPTLLRRPTQQPYQLYDRTYRGRPRPVFADQSGQINGAKNTAVQYTGSDPYQGPQWQVMRRQYTLVDQSSPPDADPTVTRQLFAYSNPYQLRSPLPWYRIRPVRADQSDQGTATTPVKNFAIQYTGSDPYQGSQWQVMRRLYSLADQSTSAAVTDTPGGMHIQLVGITRTYGSQFQVMLWRRNVADQSTQPLDADPTLTRILGQYSRPYQLYDRTYWTRTKTIRIDQSDQTPFTPPPPQTFPDSPPGGTSLGRRGPWYPDRNPEQVLLEEEEIMVMI